jgi:hypothetical protein
MKKKILMISVAAFVLTSETVMHYPQPVKKYAPKPIKLVEKVEPIDSTVLTKELLVDYILKKDIAHPEVAYAIVRLESNMCSDLYKHNKNLFGMKHPGVRPTKSLGRKSGFAHFEKWQHSVEDYKLYLEFVGGHEMSKDQYLSHLDRNYAHPGYSSLITKFFDEFHEIKNK